jgi:hypothetical protein
MNLQLTTEQTKLAELGIDLEKLSNYQVICLPQNVFGFDKSDDLYDAGHARHLAKLLKAADIRCATAFDLGLDVPLLTRRSGDTWLGVVWIRDTLALPLIVGVISSLIASDIHDKTHNQVEATVHVELYIERGANVTKLSYKGDGDTLIKMLKSLEPEGKAE